MDKFYVVQDECIDCGICVALCPENAAFSIGGCYAIDAGKCNGCGECANACPVCCIKRTWVIDDPGPSPSLFDLDDFWELAEAWMYTPYLYGGNDPSGIDCSHLTWQMLCEMGVYYPYEASYGLPSSDYFEIILESQLQAGDLLVWQWHHVAIYAGEAVPSGYDQSCDIYGTTNSQGAIYNHSTYWRIRYGPPICLRYHPPQ